jgi:uncharacterized protein YnzC (UPF0291/DUF896 family)
MASLNKIVDYLGEIYQVIEDESLSTEEQFGKAKLRWEKLKTIDNAKKDHIHNFRVLEDRASEIESLFEKQIDAEEDLIRILDELDHHVEAMGEDIEYFLDHGCWDE